MSFIHRLVSWLRDETAQTMAEYGLILALVSVVAIVALIMVGDNLYAVFEDIAGTLLGVA
jgi:Flp pilus assembly pilin Flp